VIALARETVNGGNVEIVTELIDGVLRRIASHPRRSAMMPVIVAIEGCDKHCLYIAPIVAKLSEINRLDMIMMTETHDTLSGNLSLGVPKTREHTKSMVSMTTVMLAAKLVRIAHDCVSISSSKCIKKHGLDTDDLPELQRQAATYRIDKGKYSGKASGNDDLWVAFMMTFLWMTVFSDDPRGQYVHFKRRFGNPEYWQQGTVQGMSDAQY
jgi:hypothetical protein